MEPFSFNEEALFNPDYEGEFYIKAVSMALSNAEKSKLLNMESRIKKKIIGQDAAISAVCRAVRRSRVGFRDPVKPVGCFMFLGTSGVGKTELCKELANALYGVGRNFIKIDMSEYNTKWDVQKLTGASPGYTGYEDGGRLVNAILLNPKAVLCLDEIEKAHPDVFNIFLQIMEDGVLTSGKGETVSFKDILIVMTSNIGADELAGNSGAIGFMANNCAETDIQNKIKGGFEEDVQTRIFEQNRRNCNF